MTTVAIIGAGQLGSRHLQALNLSEKELNIVVIDSNKESLSVAQSRFESCVGAVAHQVSYQQDWNISGVIDIAIVASTANSRRAIIEQLLATAMVKHLVLEKLLFTQEQDYFAIAELLQKTQTKTWVNCAMRMMPFYNQFHQVFHNTAINYQVFGSQYGLITNAIHYLDHVAYLTGSSDFELDTKSLDNVIIPSKRSHYYELTGALIARFKNDSIALLHCSSEGVAPIQIEIYNNENRVISRENEHKAWVTGLNHDWKWQEKDAPIPFQSTLTAELVASLLETNHCMLTDYATSMKIHLQLLRPLQKFVMSHGLNSEVDYPFT